MSDIVIRVENLSKHYRLGQIGSGTLRDDLQSWWAGKRGRPDPSRKLSAKDESRSREHWALRDVSFDVRQGQVLGIIGRNGAGKSTLLKILSRITAPTSGNAVIRGRIGSLLEVGTGFHPELTGRENIFLNGAILGMKRAEITKKFDEIVQFADMTRFIDTPVKRYSSGMTVRLAFAVAAHLEPEIMIIDEVLAVGDTAFQERCLGKLKQIAVSGRTVLFVSHNMSAIAKLTDRCLVLSNGTVAVMAATQDAIDVYFDVSRTPEYIFERPEDTGDENAIIKRVEVGPISGAGALLNSEEGWIRVEMTSEIDSRIAVSIEVFRQDGTCIHQVSDEDSRAQGKSKQTLVWRTPPYFLAVGRYSICITVFQRNVQVLDRIEGICPFEVRDAGSLAARNTGDWHGMTGYGFGKWSVS
jgi:lipopolysaccharide transport system ATP-binding protein